MEVFGKDERANADEDEAAEDFGAFADGAAQEAAQAQADGGHDGGGQADGKGGEQDVDFEEGQADADDHGVDAGGEGDGDKHQRRGRAAAGLAAFGLRLCRLLPDGLLRLQRAVNHAQAEQEQQGEGDPVVPIGDVALCHGADCPADERGEGFHAAEHGGGAQRAPAGGRADGGALGDGGGEGVHRHAEGEGEDGEEAHGGWRLPEAFR